MVIPDDEDAATLTRVLALGIADGVTVTVTGPCVTVTGSLVTVTGPCVTVIVTGPIGISCEVIADDDDNLGLDEDDTRALDLDDEDDDLKLGKDDESFRELEEVVLDEEVVGFRDIVGSVTVTVAKDTPVTVGNGRLPNKTVIVVKVY